MQAGKKTVDLQFDENTLHEYIAKATTTLPDDVQQIVMRAADDAGAIKGTILLLDILRHLRVGDDADLSEKARQVLKSDGE